MIDQNHYGGLKNRSSTVAVIDIFEKLTKEKINKRNVALVSMDQSSAFDVLPHKWLKEKLIHIGIEEESVKMIMTYLDDRKQAVYINGNTSETLNTGPYSVCQGTVLSGLFYLIYTLDMNLQTHNTKII